MRGGVSGSWRRAVRQLPAPTVTAVRYPVGNRYYVSNNHNHVEEVINDDKHHRAFRVITGRWFQPAIRR